MQLLPQARNTQLLTPGQEHAAINVEVVNFITVICDGGVPDCTVAGSKRWLK